MHPSPKNIIESPEWKLLLAAISSDEARAQHLRELLETPVDWDQLLRLADRHAVSSLICRNLEPLASAVPPAAFKALRQKYELNIHKSLFLARELVRILDCLESRGIPVLPYKGVVLSETCYGDMALRQSGDIDLFVRANDVARVKNVLSDLGYQPRLTLPAGAEAAYIAAGYEYSFNSPAGNNLLELQWALQPRYYAVDFDMEGLFNRAATVKFSERSIKTPSAEDLLLILSLHAAKHVWERLIWLCDIAQLLKRDLNWDWIQSQAQTLGVERILHITLLLTSRLLDSRLPPALQSAINTDHAALDFANQVTLSIAAGVDYEQQKLAYFRLMIRLRERPIDQLRFLTRLTFTPGPGEWQTIKLPRIFFPFYRIVRLARLVGRFGRR